MPAPLAEGKLALVYASCGLLAQVLLALPQFVIGCSDSLTPPSVCTHTAFWRGTFEAAPQWRRGWGRGRNLGRRERC